MVQATLPENNVAKTKKAEEKEPGKEPVVTVKIPASIHSKARKIAAFTNQTIEQILAELLRDPVDKRLRQVLNEAREA